MGYNLKIISSGEERLEIYKVTGYDVKNGFEGKNKEGRRGKDEISEEQKAITSKRNRKLTLNRARNDIIRLIKSNSDMNIFITLTYSYDVEYKESKKHLNNFFTKLRRDYENLKYLWVLEFTKKDRIHYHLLANIPIDISNICNRQKKSEEHKAIENNFRAKYWKHGFIDLRALSKEGNTNIALYVACYIVKDLLDKDLGGDRVYGYSKRTLNKPMQLKIQDDRPIEELLNDFKEDYEITYSNSYSIGYVDKDNKEHRGVTTYFDLKKRCSDVSENNTE